MNYRDQQRYFVRSRIWGATAVALLISTAAWAAWAFWRWSSTRALIGYWLTIAAIAASLYYLPDYLHLTVNPEKRRRWATKVRWRLALLTVVFSAFLARHLAGFYLGLICAAWIIATNVIVSRVLPKRIYVLAYWLADVLLILALLTPVWFDRAPLWFAISVIFSVLIWEINVWPWVAVLVISSAVVLSVSLAESIPGFDHDSVWLLSQLVLLPAMVAVAAGVLVTRARKHASLNSETASNELAELTGYAPPHIRELWTTADKQLARSWDSSDVAAKSPEEIAEWYRQNSELYMFAISAYNLEYKRIRSNLKALRYASGACLDYGAGNGELILECARRGNRAAYYDVDGVSKRFAQFRAAKYGLGAEFPSSKDELRRIAEVAPFDTIFSFDVLEHIPDLAGELDFLLLLLSPGGLLIFDVPAGATVSHPMHLNHTLNIREHMLARGVIEVPMRSRRIGKQEKYAFRKVSGIAEELPVKEG